MATNVQYLNRRKVGSHWVVTELADDGFPGVNIWLLGEDDPSAGLHVNYDERCVNCYLGHAHSLFLHKANIAKALA